MIRAEALMPDSLAPFGEVPDASGDLGRIINLAEHRFDQPLSIEAAPDDIVGAAS